MHNLAVSALYGIGTEKDEVFFFNLTKHAAALGHVEAMSNLAVWYGFTTSPQFAKFRYLRRRLSCQPNTLNTTVTFQLP